MFNTLRSLSSRLRQTTAQSPFLLFFGAILLLFGIIVLAHFSRNPAAPEATLTKTPKTVSRFTIGTDLSYTNTSAVVHKDAVQPIVALLPGTVESIAVHPGDRVNAATPLMRLSTDYGSDAAGQSVSLTEKRQRFAEEMRHLDLSILDLEKKRTRQDGSLTDTAQDLALKQLKRERAALKESLENGALEVKLTQANESVFQPRPFNTGIVEHIAVSVGDFVTPGTIVATLYSAASPGTLEAAIDPRLAHFFNPTLPSKLTLSDNETIELTPTSFSRHETTDGLFMIRYALPKEYLDRVTDNERLELSLPLSSPTDGTLVPLDALFTHTDHASLFINTDGKAEERTVTVRSIIGQSALLTESLPYNTSVLLDRTLIHGESITPAQ